jgi:hypothetical protein
MFITESLKVCSTSYRFSRNKSNVNNLHFGDKAAQLFSQINNK